MISIFLEDGKNLQAIYRHINQAMVKKWYIKGISAFPSGEIRPGSLLPAITLGKSGDLTIVPMFWGMTFPPIPGKTTGCFLYEVKTDLPKEKKDRLWSFHRCLVPMSWFYEAETRLDGTTGSSIPGAGRYLCQPNGTAFCYLACIYHLEDGYPAFAVCTRPSLMDLFPSVPIIFGKETVHDWISPSQNPESLFRSRYISFITDYEGISE